MIRFDVAADFKTHTTDHVLTVVRDDGVYRHLRCRQPGTSMWGWDIITWPGYLAMTGDLGAWAFCREEDMLRDFFRGAVNVSYWLEKCTAWHQGTSRDGVVSLARILSHFDKDEAATIALTAGDIALSHRLGIPTEQPALWIGACCLFWPALATVAALYGLWYIVIYLPASLIGNAVHALRDRKPPEMSDRLAARLKLDADIARLERELGMKRKPEAKPYYGGCYCQNCGRQILSIREASLCEPSHAHTTCPDREDER